MKKEYWLHEKLFGFALHIFTMKLSLKKIILFPIAIITILIDYSIYGWLLFGNSSGPN